MKELCLDNLNYKKINKYTEIKVSSIVLFGTYNVKYQKVFDSFTGKCILCTSPGSKCCCESSVLQQFRHNCQPFGRWSPYHKKVCFKWLPSTKFCSRGKDTLYLLNIIREIFNFDWISKKMKLYAIHNQLRPLSLPDRDCASGTGSW